MNGTANFNGLSRADARRELMQMTMMLAVIQLQYPKESGEDVRGALKLISELYNRMEVPALPTTLPTKDKP